MSKAGRSGDTVRAPRNNNVPKEDEEQTELEAELGASGRHHAFPREGLVGAHAERRSSATPAHDAGDQRAGANDDDAPDAGEPNEEGEEPTGPGSDVAPTKLAEARERERHRLERSLGHTPAGEEGLIHGRSAPGVTREKLDEAAREADRRIVGHELPPKRS